MDISKPDQLEYVWKDEAPTDMQAPGPVGQDKVARLNDLEIADGETQDDGNFAMEEDQTPTYPQVQQSPQRYKSKGRMKVAKDGVAGALIPSYVRA